MKLVRVYSDAQGETHFGELDVELAPVAFARRRHRSTCRRGGRPAGTASWARPPGGTGTGTRPRSAW